MPNPPPEVTDQLDSPSFLLPVEDTNFLLRDEMRAVRFALEYAKADLLLRDWGVRSTIIVFGSARVPSPERMEESMISSDDLQLFDYADSAEDIWCILIERGLRTS